MHALLVRFEMSDRVYSAATTIIVITTNFVLIFISYCYLDNGIIRGYLISNMKISISIISQILDIGRRVAVGEAMI